MTDIQIIRQTRTEFSITYPEGTNLAGKTPLIEIRDYITRALALTLNVPDELTVAGRVITAVISTAQSELLTSELYRADVALVESGEVTRTGQFRIAVA